MTLYDSKKGIWYVVITTGIASVATQIAVIREIMAQFSGNELVIAISLFSWLIYGGIGTWLFLIISRNPEKPTPLKLALLSWSCVALAPLTILFIRILRKIVFTPGTEAGFHGVFFFVLTVLAPYGLLVGALLPYAFAVASKFDKNFPGPTIYLLDNLGDIMGGALFSFLLVRLLPDMGAVLAANLPLLITPWLLLDKKKQRGLVPAVGFCAAALLLLFGLYADGLSRCRPGGVLVEASDSKFGRVEVMESSGEYTLFSDGIPVLMQHDVSSAEEIAHIPLSQAVDPSKILIIGAASGVLPEIEKYFPSRIDLVEINPDITRLGQKYGLLRKTPATHFLHADGRAYLQHAGISYDVIIVNIAEPATLQTNRFFTLEFMRLAKRRLGKDGIFAFSLAGYDNYPGISLTKAASIAYWTAKDVFPYVLVLPGTRIHFVCSETPVNPDIPGLLTQKNITTLYISFFFAGNVTPERINDLMSRIEKNIQKNRDLYPRLIYCFVSYWFEAFKESPYIFYGIFLFSVLLYVIFSSRESLILFSSGAIVMGSEILVLFAFQVYQGYIYEAVGRIITSFLLGLLLGVLWGRRDTHSNRKKLIFADAGLCLALGFVIFMVTSFGESLYESLYWFFGISISFFCGMQFPAAYENRGGGRNALVSAFSADLLGAAAGSLATASILVPLFGWPFAGLALLSFKLVCMTRSHG